MLESRKSVLLRLGSYFAIFFHFMALFLQVDLLALSLSGLQR
jgi:hypothetical protein